jgi:Mn-dependent DtxR family transcriptional regulator
MKSLTQIAAALKTNHSQVSQVVHRLDLQPDGYRQAQNRTSIMVYSKDSQRRIMEIFRKHRAELIKSRVIHFKRAGE